MSSPMSGKSRADPPTPQAPAVLPAVSPAASPAGRWLRLAPALALLLALAAALASGLAGSFDFAALLARRAELAEWVAHRQIVAVFAFVAVYAASVALSIPGATLMTIIAGFLFGGLLGGAVAALAATLGAAILFLIARSAFGATLAERLGPRLDRLRDGFQRDAASYLLFLRLTPVFPFWLVNLAAAALQTPFRTFVWTTLVGVAPAAFAFAMAGAGLDSLVVAHHKAYLACMAAGQGPCRAALAPHDLLTRDIVWALAALGVVALIPPVLRRLRGPAAPSGEP